MRSAALALLVAIASTGCQYSVAIGSQNAGDAGGPDIAATDVATPLDGGSPDTPFDSASTDADDTTDTAMVVTDATTDGGPAPCASDSDCPSGSTCNPMSHACVSACAMGRLDCDGNSMNGCEVDSLSDSNNCGTCGTVCAMGSCSGGACR